MDPLVARVTARHVEAGLFEPPPRLLQAVRDWVFQTYASHALGWAEKLLDEAQSVLSNGKTDLHRIERARQQFTGDVRALEQKPRVPTATLTYSVGTGARPRRLTLKCDSKSQRIKLYEESPGKGPMGQRPAFDGWASDAAWAKGLLKAGERLFDLYVQTLPGSIQMWSTLTPEKAKEQLTDAAMLKGRASKYTSDARVYLSEAKAKIPVDLTDWKYLTPEEQAGVDSEITCSLFFGTHQTRGGMWQSGTRTLQVDLPEDVRNERAFTFNLSWVDDILYHEVQHAGQYFLTQARKGLHDHAGVPSRHIQNPERRRKDVEHDLLDTEFYPELTEAIRQFLRSMRVRPVKDWRQAARIFVGETGSVPPADDWDWTHKFFKLLRDKAPDKWRKAVKEFWKAVEPQMS